MPSVVSALRLAASARMRRSMSLSISRAQLMSSSGTLISPLRAHFTRSAQCASICSLSACLVEAEQQKRPDLLARQVASSSTTGSTLRP